MSEPAAGPASTLALFRACNGLALQGFGGVLPVAQRELVDRRAWVSRERFLELLSLAQVLPGPSVINLLIMLGHGWFGWRGVVAAMTGILLVPLVLVLTLAALAAHGRQLPLVDGALRGMGVVAAALVLSTAIKLAPALRANPMGQVPVIALVLLTAVAVGWLRWPLVAVVLGLGLPACALAARRLPRP
ncbi:MAG TPA: chromate transporter [Rubrivivax sp.]|nr:chromate transporter [Rubrivivax sp.]